MEDVKYIPKNLIERRDELKLKAFLAGMNGEYYDRKKDIINNQLKGIEDAIENRIKNGEYLYPGDR